jgi:hypothetical protein
VAGRTSLGGAAVRRRGRRPEEGRGVTKSLCGADSPLRRGLRRRRGGDGGGRRPEEGGGGACRRWSAGGPGGHEVGSGGRECFFNQRTRAVGMKKGERIPDMQHGRTGAAFCRSLCSDSWRLYSGLAICILQMHTVLQIPLESV